MVIQRDPRAVLDIGSNTIRLLVANSDGTSLDRLDDSSEFVRLGKGVHASGRLQEDRVAAAIEAIGRLAARASGLGAGDVIAIATSAVRDAANRAEFVDRVRAATGIRIRILSGDEEAQLTYLGATLGRSLDGGAVICDLGGGSAEIIFATDGHIEWARSLQLGSGRLTELFVHHSPPHRDELDGVRGYVRGLLCDLPPARAASTILTGGTASHIAFLLGEKGGERNLTLRELEGVVSLCERASVDELVEEFGIGRERAEVLASGVTAAATLVRYYGSEQVTITVGGIREGAIVEAVRGPQQ